MRGGDGIDIYTGDVDGDTSGSACGTEFQEKVKFGLVYFEICTVPHGSCRFGFVWCVSVSDAGRCGWAWLDCSAG